MWSLNGAKTVGCIQLKYLTKLAGKKKRIFYDPSFTPCTDLVFL